jgi:hypothetical protein
MYAIVQTRFRPHELHSTNHCIGIASTTKSYTNSSGTLESIRYNDIAIPLKELMKSEFEELNIGFFLILE